MRFKSKITKENLIILQSITSIFEKQARTAAIFLDEEFFRIAVITENLDSPKCFSELSTENIFSEYRIESQSNNKILFEIGLANFTEALASGRHSPQCQLKLVKRGLRPCLCFETKSIETLSVDIVHDIPIQLIKPGDIIYYMPPEVPPPTVSLELQRNLKLMRTILDRMSRFSKYIQLTAQQCGNLTLHVEHSTAASIKTYFTGLVPRFDENLRFETDRDNKGSVKVDLKKLSSVLNVSTLPLDVAYLFLTHNQSLLLHLSLCPHGSGSLTFYLPVILLPEEEEEEEGGREDGEIDREIEREEGLQGLIGGGGGGGGEDSFSI